MAIKKITVQGIDLTAKGAETMTMIGRGDVSFFDGGIVQGQGSYGSEIAKSGVLVRLCSLGLLENQGGGDESNESGDWYVLTALGAVVANELAGNVVEEAPAEEAPAEEAPALPLSKTSVYAQLKAIREALREAERAIERGDTSTAFEGLGLAANRATDLDRDARHFGINGL